MTPGLNRAFDHSKTKFALLGKHAEVECVKCHAGGDFTKRVTFQEMFRLSPARSPRRPVRPSQPAEPSVLHAIHVEGFKPSTFGLKEHAMTGYPLQGKHATVPCTQCHVSTGSLTIYKIKFQFCTDCHAMNMPDSFPKRPISTAAKIATASKGFGHRHSALPVTTTLPSA